MQKEGRYSWNASRRKRRARRASRKKSVEISKNQRKQDSEIEEMKVRIKRQKIKKDEHPERPAIQGNQPKPRGTSMTYRMYLSDRGASIACGVRR
jgi:hypothetical protein